MAIPLFPRCSRDRSCRGRIVAIGDCAVQVQVQVVAGDRVEVVPEAHAPSRRRVAAVLRDVEADIVPVLRAAGGHDLKGERESLTGLAGGRWGPDDVEARDSDVVGGADVALINVGRIAKAGAMICRRSCWSGRENGDKEHDRQARAATDAGHKSRSHRRWNLFSVHFCPLSLAVPV